MNMKKKYDDCDNNISANLFSKKDRYAGILFSVIASLGIISYLASGATTISTNISTGGTISLSSGSPLAFSSSATSTIPNNLVNVWSIATSSEAEPIISIDTTSGAGGSASGGSVGIGTAYMPSKLTVKGSDGWTSVSTLNSSDEEVVGFGARTNGTGVFQMADADETITTLFKNDGTAGYILSGNFGFGTSTPGAKLAVQGNAQFSGNLNAANITATGTVTAATFSGSGSGLTGVSASNLITALTATTSADTVVASTTNEFSFSTLTIPADTLQAGNAYKIMAWVRGISDTGGTDLLLNVKMGNTLISPQSATGGIDAAGKNIKIDIDLFVFSIGTSGKVSADGLVMFADNTFTIFTTTYSIFQIDTTADQTISIRPQWNTTGNATTSLKIFYISKI